MSWNPFRRRAAQPPSEGTQDPASADVPATAPDTDYGEALAPTRGGLFGAIRQLFHDSRRLDAEFWEELEELLIASDVGAMTTARLTETLQRTVRDQGITDAGPAEDALKAQLVQQLVSSGRRGAGPAPRRSRGDLGRWGERRWEDHHHRQAGHLVATPHRTTVFAGCRGHVPRRGD